MNDIIANSIIPVDGNDVQQNSIVTYEVQPNKRRRKKSEVWQYFTTQPISEDCTRACCKQCNRSFVYINGKKQSGTSHLRRHIMNGVCPPKNGNKGTSQLFPYSPDSPNGAITAPPRKRCRATPESVTVALNQEHYTTGIARMIICHDYPANMVEQPGFINFARFLRPEFSMASFTSVQNEIMSIYRREKCSVANMLEEIPGRVSIAIDYWTSDHTVGYAMLTCHFVDADWKFQRRVLNFLTVPFPESEVAFNQAIASCLSEWKLGSKLFALTVDQSFANEAVIENIKNLLKISNPHMLNGQFLLDQCYTRVITRLALDALSSTREAVSKVRDSVKFVKSSVSREGKFNKLRQQLQVPCTENLVLDNHGEWDSTYHMLSTACALKEVFSCLDTSDASYNLAPSIDDWKCVETLCAYLKLFFDSTNILLSETYPAAHIFFREAYKIRYQLVFAALNSAPVVSDFVRPLLEKFDLYWRNYAVVLAMAATMDPRYKLELARYTFNKFYGDHADTWVKATDESLHDLFFEYVAQTLPLPSIHIEEQRYDDSIKAESLLDDVTPPDDEILDFDIYISELSSDQTKSELDQYLEEKCLPREELDVIDWWKFNRIRYPILSKMAADMLSIPCSTVHRDSVFDTATRKLDSDQCSLRPGTLEAVICAKDWLRFGTRESSSASMSDWKSPFIVKKSAGNVLDSVGAS